MSSPAAMLTLDTAAERLGICGKTLVTFLRDHPADPPLFAKLGRKYIISPDDLDRIYQRLQVFYGTQRFYIEEFERRSEPVPAPPSESGYVYFVLNEARNMIKIGFALDPAKRLKVLSTSSPDQLKLLGTMPGTMATERALHEKFAKLRGSGEWFSASQRLINFALSPKRVSIE